MHLLVANLLQYMPAKNYENRLTHVKVTSEDKVGLFIETQCILVIEALNTVLSIVEQVRNQDHVINLPNSRICRIKSCFSPVTQGTCNLPPWTPEGISMGAVASN